MGRVSHNKLVRDNIPDIIRAKGEMPVTRKLKKAEFRTELKKKLVEEARELLDTQNKKELVKEVADVEEVLLALYEIEKIDRKEVNKIRREKLQKRGGFIKKIFLIETK